MFFLRICLAALTLSHFVVKWFINLINRRFVLFSSYTMKKLTIRAAAIQDTKAIVDIHSRSIRVLCAQDYTLEQIEAWAGGRTPEQYISRIQRDPTFVAEFNNKIVGFVRFYMPTGELASIFVDPHYARMGIGSALMNRAVAEAKERGLTSFWLDASITAVPFYQHLGFTIEKEIVHRLPTALIEGMRMVLLFDTVGT